jgi:hypothetical protein
MTMTPAEALQHVIDMSTDGSEAVSDLRTLGFAVIPIEPDDAAIERAAGDLADDVTDACARSLYWRNKARDAYDAVVKERCRPHRRET